MKFGSKQLIPIATGALAATFIFIGVSHLGFWEEVRGPGSGFVPTIIAVIMLAISLLALLQSRKEEKAVFPRENWLVVLGGAAIIAATMLLGLIPSCLVFVAVWLRLVEKSSWKETLIVLAVIGTIIIGVFVIWLGVPFPQGLILDTLLG